MTALRRRLPERTEERGVTLVELLVTCVVLLVVLPTAGGLLHSAVVSQRDVASVTQANTVAQAIASSVEAGVRNSAAVRLTTTGTPWTTSSDQLLVSRVRIETTGSSTWACRAWFYSAAERTLYTRSVPVTATTTPITAPTATTLAEWSTLARAVALRTPDPSRPEVKLPVFALTGDLRRVDLDLTVSTGTERRPADLSTSIVRRPQGQTKGAPCF